MARVCFTVETMHLVRSLVLILALLTVAGGRFLSADPMGHAASMSLYDYCNGDPVNGLDPDGRMGVGANVESSGSGDSGLGLNGGSLENPQGQQDQFNDYLASNFGTGPNSDSAAESSLFAPSDEDNAMSDAIASMSPAMQGRFLNYQYQSGQLGPDISPQQALGLALLAVPGGEAEGAYLEAAGAAGEGAGAGIDMGLNFAGRQAAESTISETQGAITNLGSRTVQSNAALLDALPSGGGMSGVFDHSTGNFVLRNSSDVYGPLPEGWVRQTGGHASVRSDLGLAIGEDLSGAAPGRLSGFAVVRGADGQIQFRWNSGQINIGSHGTRAVPEPLRPEIENTVKAATGG